MQFWNQAYKMLIRPCSRLGSGAASYALPRGLGRSPRNRCDFEHFMPKLGPFSELVNLRSVINQMEKIVD